MNLWEYEYWCTHGLTFHQSNFSNWWPNFTINANPTELIKVNCLNFGNFTSSNQLIVCKLSILNSDKIKSDKLLHFDNTFLICMISVCRISSSFFNDNFIIFSYFQYFGLINNLFNKLIPFWMIIVKSCNLFSLKSSSLHDFLITWFVYTLNCCKFWCLCNCFSTCSLDHFLSISNFTKWVPFSLLR